MKETIGVLGGSFDPPHVAHVLVAAWALSVTDVSRVLVVPALRHPFAKSLRPFEHRVKMCELAFADLARTSVSTLAEEVGGDGYTIDLLQALTARHPEARLRLVIGSDLVAGLGKWRDAPRVAALAPALVVGRAGHGTHDLSLPDVSSTEIRRRLAAREPATGLVPRSVEAYITEHALYVE